MQAGKLRKRVDVQQLTAAPSDPALQDPYNAPPPPADDGNWETLVTRWAFVRPLSGRELFQARQVRPDVTHRVTMRWFTGAWTGNLAPGVGPKMRLLLQQTRRLNVLYAVNVEERDRELDLLCIEEV